MLVSVARDSFANNYARIIDGLCHGENLEIALRNIAKCIQVKHLPIYEEECVLGVVAGGRRTDDHSGGIWTLAANTEGGAGRSAQSSQICNGVDYLRLEPGKRTGKEECGGKNSE